jgi:hypothetical protein
LGNSATIEFMPGRPGGLRITAGGETNSPTIEAVVTLGRLVELEPVISSVSVAGFLIRLDAKKNGFKIQRDDGGPPLADSYDDTVISGLRDAWSHRVVADIASTEHRHAYASHAGRLVAAPIRAEEQSHARPCSGPRRSRSLVHPCGALACRPE